MLISFFNALRTFPVQTLPPMVAKGNNQTASSEIGERGAPTYAPVSVKEEDSSVSGRHGLDDTYRDERRYDELWT